VNTLQHSPADIVRQVLVDANLLGSLAAYVGSEPDHPDDVVTLYSTAGKSDGRTMVDSEEQLRFGVQIRVRYTDSANGYAYASQLAESMDTVRMRTVTLDSVRYLVPCLQRLGPVRDLGKALPSSKRNLYTFDLTSAIRRY
jgi:hypothetical protein